MAIALAGFHEEQLPRGKLVSCNCRGEWEGEQKTRGEIVLGGISWGEMSVGQLSRGRMAGHQGLCFLCGNR